MLISSGGFLCGHRTYSIFSSPQPYFPGHSYLLWLFILYTDICCKVIFISHCTRSEQEEAFCHKATEGFHVQNKMNKLLKLQLELY